MISLFLSMVDKGSSSRALNKVGLDRESLDIMHILQHSLFLLLNLRVPKVEKD